MQTQPAIQGCHRHRLLPSPSRPCAVPRGYSSLDLPRHLSEDRPAQGTAVLAEELVCGDFGLVGFK